MKRIGMIGGMSWESSLEYYRLINEGVKEALGGSHSANCLMYSFDFQIVEDLQHQGKWDVLTDMMVKEAQNLKKAGAQCIVICTNTMHKMAPDIVKETGLPLIHIAEATAQEILARGVKKVLLLGTRYTMTGDFYREKIEEKGIELIIPSEEDMDIIHQVIYEELILGQVRDESRKDYIRIINKGIEAGADGVVLGCTEIPLLIKEDHVSCQVFDTTAIHCQAAVKYALS